MPHIPYWDKQKIDVNLDPVLTALKDHRNAGHAAYIIYKVLVALLGAGPNFSRLASAMGACEGALVEFKRKHVIPYEQMKEEENGAA